MDRNWNGRITAQELRRSNFLQTLALLEEEPDINQINDYFSYEHFYVIYCKFWELDTDHDLLIDAQDLARHADHGEFGCVFGAQLMLDFGRRSAMFVGISCERSVYVLYSLLYVPFVVCEWVC